VLALADVDLGDALAARLEALRATPFSRAEARAAGSDLLLELTRASGEGRAPRLTRREESVRSVVHLALEWLPEDREALALRHARAALSRAAPARVCDAAFEEPLRAALGRESLARSLAPNGSFTDAYVALAIEQLAAESPGGALRLRDGTELRVDGPLALARAAAQASDVDGLLAAVRSVAESLAPEGGVGEALHAWLAPELAPDAFAQVLARADAAQARCRAMR
jgi:hypothetical protein